jgi:hypothetical protein
MLNNVSVCETVRTRGPKNKILEKKLPIARDKEVAPEEVTPEEVTLRRWPLTSNISFGHIFCYTHLVTL